MNWTSPRMFVLPLLELPLRKPGPEVPTPPNEGRLEAIVPLALVS
jgi:hypothetical protein